MIIGVEGLPLPEINLLRTILKLSTQLVNNWTLSEEGPCHVLLTTLAVTPDQTREGSQPQIVVPIVRRGRRPPGECLERPIRAEDFIELLKRLGPLLKIDTGPTRGREPNSAPTAQRGRLKRWPPSQLMGSDRKFIQLATFLSRRARSASELSSVAGYPETECGAFMLELDRHDLLSWDMREQPPIITSGSIRAAKGSEAPGLLNSIRRRLGLSWNNRRAG
jgi:hypothetical protein